MPQSGRELCWVHPLTGVSVRRGRGCPGPAPGGLTTGPPGLSAALGVPVRTAKWHLAARCEGRSVRNGPVSTKDEKERGGNALERAFPMAPGNVVLLSLENGGVKREAF